jgi:hypothetical protein
MVPGQGIGVPRVARHLAGLVDAGGVAIRDARWCAQGGHAVRRVPEEGVAAGGPDHLAGVVKVGRTGGSASIQRSQIDHEIVAPVQVAVPEPHAPLRVDQKRVRGPIGTGRRADHLAHVIDAGCGTGTSAQGPQVDHRAVFPEEGMAEAVFSAGLADHLAGLVEIGGVTAITAERAQVRDRIQRRHAAVFQAFEARPVRCGPERPPPVMAGRLARSEGGADVSQPTGE